MISYIYRHSLAYDTLMQMGRWFGYRDGYADCCRIYMDPESIAWYSTISNATDELRKEIKRMNLRGAIPLEFGLKVREDPEVPLIVTARNKMRSTFVRTYASSLSSTMVETQSLYSDDEHNQNNLKLIRNFIDKNNSKLKKDKKLFCLRNVDRSDIIDLLNNIAISELNTRFDPFAISDFIKKYAGRELEEWDVVFATGVGATYQIADGIEVKLNKRRASLVRDNKFLLLNHNRLGSADDMSFGLSAEQKVLAQVQTGDKKHPSANDFLSQEIGPRKPLLVIYFVEPTDKSGDKLLPNNQIPAIGFAIGIPYLADQETKYINYRVNRIHEAYGEILDDEDEEDDVEAKTDDNNENDRNNKNDQDNK